MSSSVKSPALLDVHVVEEHNEALAHIYRAIARGKLPFKELVLLHFDAHPDLLSPDIQAHELEDKEQLFSTASIAEWILPAVYMGHFGRVVWVKPPWARQMPEGPHHLCVGKHRATGQLRVASPLPYFISELLSVDGQELENCTSIPLDVFTLHPSPHPQHDIKSVPTPSLSASRAEVSNGSHTHPQIETEDTTLETTLPPPATKKAKLCEASREDTGLPTLLNKDLINILNTTSQAWVLDIDLDFFSTGNPYRSVFTKDQYKLLASLYLLQEPANEEAVVECVERRGKQLDGLERMWTLADITEESRLQFNLSPHDEILIKEMKELMGQIHNDSFINPEYLHIAGMMTDLPVHTSSEGEIAGLVSTMSRLLHNLTTRPSLVTVARSTDDEYTPPMQVDSIQQQVLSALKHLYENRGSCDPLQQDGKGYGSRDPLQQDGKGSRDPLQQDGKGSRDPLQQDGKGSRDPLQQDGKGSRDPLQQDGKGSSDSHKPLLQVHHHYIL